MQIAAGVAISKSGPRYQVRLSEIITHKKLGQTACNYCKGCIHEQMTFCYDLRQNRFHPPSISTCELTVIPLTTPN